MTFNYDRMLEVAFADVLMHYIKDDLDSYLTDDFALIKPHGSVDWMQQLGTASAEPVRMRETLELTAIEMAARPDLTVSEITFRGAPNQPWHPAIAIPLDRGKTFVCPQKHLDRLSSDLNEVTHVLVVGWRATERHFLAKLEDRLPKNRTLSLCIVDKDDGGHLTLKNLQDVLGKVISFDPVQVHDGGFSEFVRGQQVQGWLSGAA